MSEEMAERLILLAKSVIRMMREEQARTGSVPDHMFENAEALLDTLIEAMPLDPNPFSQRAAGGGERMADTQQIKEVHVTYMVTGTENEIREQAEQLQNSSPSNWKLQEAKSISESLFSNKSR